MKIFPAIDIIEGKAVRLFQGDYSKKTVYSESPLKVAKEFKEKGARFLHIVDLDGAKKGKPCNMEIIGEILKETGLFVEIGGGIRDAETVKKYIDIGVSRVILGTAAVENPDFTKEMIRKYGGKIGIGVDVRNGYVATRGWEKDSGIGLMGFVKELEKIGAEAITVTDISKDGAMQGINADFYKEIKEKTDLKITAAGGITDISDIERLSWTGIDGAIIGKALYTGNINLEDALKKANPRREITACLDNSNGKVVKGIKFKEIKELGDPVAIAKKYDKAGIDQLAFYDISASIEGRTLFLDLLKEVTSNISTPVNAAGGISTIEDCEAVFEAGAAKVSINTGAIKNPEFVKEAAEKFGSEKITVSADISKTVNGYHIFSAGGQKDTQIDALEWIKKMDAYGAGGFIINSIDKDGVKDGFDIDLIKAITDITDVPVTASGGAGSIEDFVQLFTKVPKTAGGLAASIFHYGEVDIAKLKEELEKKEL